MKINEFIEKYKGDNFESYLKENATVDYWNELVKTYKTDKLYLSDYDQFRTIFICRHIENDNGIGITFDKFCERQIKILEINAQYEPQQIETVKPDRVLKNEFDKIFNSDIGFTIFTKMFDLYKTENTDLANFSFLFYAMEKDFLVCSQTEFITFLENDKYDVNIEKIDSRQSGKNKKSKLYNSIKETLQKKYEKSTI